MSLPSRQPPAGRIPGHEQPDRPLDPLEAITLAHVGSLLLLASWAFGGSADWARLVISCWGSLGVFITFRIAARRRDWRSGPRPPLRWLWPLAAYNLLVLLSCLNPSFAGKTYEGQPLLAFTGAVYPHLPSTAHPATSLTHLWLLDAVYLSCLNLALVIRRRRALRALLFVAGANAVLLSIFGTFQALLSDGLYFGLVAPPNPRFFATFVYANHWSAYVVLMITLGTGLVFYFSRHRDASPLAGSTVGVGITGLILMAITPAICGSRAGTLLALAVLAFSLCHALSVVMRRRRSRHEPVALSVTGMVLCVVVAVGAAGYLGRGPLQERWTDTQGQWKTGFIAERLALYSDTWQMTSARPLFGWGLGCYDKILQLVRPRPLEAPRQYEHSYVDAHSDWLQSLAEVGYAGTLFIGLAGLLPLLDLRSRGRLGPLPAYLLGGCGLVLLYAAVEFPFANPAVVTAFWLCFFAAIQYVRLTSRPRTAG